MARQNDPLLDKIRRLRDSSADFEEDSKVTNIYAQPGATVKVDSHDSDPPEVVKPKKLGLVVGVIVGVGAVLGAAAKAVLAIMEAFK